MIQICQDVIDVFLSPFPRSKQNLLKIPWVSSSASLSEQDKLFRILLMNIIKNSW